VNRLPPPPPPFRYGEDIYAETTQKYIWTKRERERERQNNEGIE
jgi:hypothetical protein